MFRINLTTQFTVENFMNETVRGRKKTFCITRQSRKNSRKGARNEFRMGNQVLNSAQNK